MDKFVVRETSMQPALQPGDRLLATRREPEVGVIVVFPEPGDGQRWLIKRVVAVPGEDVTIEGSELSVSPSTGHRMTLRLPNSERSRRWNLSDDEVFVLSDALSATRADSRVYGPISTDRMLTVVLRYGPLRRLRRKPRDESGLRPASWDRSAWRESGR